MRIKHFDPGLAGWEEKDRAHEFVLVRLDGREALFLELDRPDPRWAVYRREGTDRLVSYFMRQNEPVTETGMFEYASQKRRGDLPSGDEVPDPLPPRAPRARDRVHPTRLFFANALTPPPLGA